MDEKVLKETLDLMNMMVEGMAKLSVLVTNLVNDGYSNPKDSGFDKNGMMYTTLDVGSRVLLKHKVYGDIPFIVVDEDCEDIILDGTSAPLRLPSISLMAESVVCKRIVGRNYINWGYTELHDYLNEEFIEGFENPDIFETVVKYTRICQFDKYGERRIIGNTFTCWIPDLGEIGTLKKMSTPSIRTYKYFNKRKECRIKNYNGEPCEYFTRTPNVMSESGSTLYSIKPDGSSGTHAISTACGVVPCLCIRKEKLIYNDTAK